MSYKPHSPSLVNTRVVRINLPAYVKLKRWCQQLDRTMAEVIDYAVKLLDAELHIKPMFALEVKLIPAVITLAPISTMAINGSRVAAFVTKLKGVKYG